ncbi:MAG: coproporphyrinogen dehydrogenase HemZ [Clostridia bacterium]|nr:coproporphyrinogen dehydrogenase HemZ [Clostridia bacterium]
MRVVSSPEWLSHDIYDVFHMFLNDCNLDENKPFVNFVMEQNKANISCILNVDFDGGTKRFEKYSTIKEYKNELEQKRYIKREVKKFIYEELSNYYNKKLPWGCLTGIRPTSIAYEMIEHGLDKVFVKEALMNDFYVREDKASLIEKIIKNQNCIIKNDNLVDLYINIPFCPSKCSYCTFISHEYCRVKNIIPNYIDALNKELRFVKKLINQKSYIVRSIYIGGGTPSVLEVDELKRILENVSYNATEFTVECGRPDTITKEKLDLLKEYGVTRISINPQSFVDATLKRIGRKHTANDTLKAYKLALDYDFSINMDIIAGLPKESFKGFKKTIDTILELYPDNVTVHTLAIKRGSSLAENNAQNEDVITSKMVDYAQSSLMENGYKPYYLYKLKNQNAGLENVGFFRDKLCIFNVDSMEETNTIIAVGAGAITKRVYSLQNKIERQANCKFANDYIDRIDEMIQKKKEIFD